MKRFAAIAVVAVLAAGLFTACGGSGGTAASPGAAYNSYDTASPQ